MHGQEDQLFPMMELICSILAGFAGFGIAFAHRLRPNHDAFMTVLFFSTFVAVVTVLLGDFVPALISVAAGALLALSFLVVEWLMPLPKPPSDEDEDGAD